MRAIGCQAVPDCNVAVPLPGDGAPAERLYFKQPSDGSGRWVSYWYHVFDTGEPQQYPGLLSLLALPLSCSACLTADIFTDDLTPADVAGLTNLPPWSSRRCRPRRCRKSPDVTTVAATT